MLFRSVVGPSFFHSLMGVLHHSAWPPCAVELALDPVPPLWPSTFIIYYPHTHTHTQTHTHTHTQQSDAFIIYCGNVLNAWLNTGTQIHSGDGKGRQGESGLVTHTHTRTYREVSNTLSFSLSFAPSIFVCLSDGHTHTYVPCLSPNVAHVIMPYLL